MSSSLCFLDIFLSIYLLIFLITVSSRNHKNDKTRKEFLQIADTRRLTFKPLNRPREIFINRFHNELIVEFERRDARHDAIRRWSFITRRGNCRSLLNAGDAAVTREISKRPIFTIIIDMPVH